MNKMWPVPLAITTLSGPLVFPIVAVLTYEDEAITQLPHIRARESSFWIGAYGLFILSLAMISFMIPWMAYFAALATLLLHEGLFLWNRKGQRNGKPAFVAPWRGIRVLELFPERVGQRMGLKQGDIILSLNGKQVNSQAMLDEILGDYPNLIWISVKREAQEVIELEYRDYEEGINDLGAMLIPRTTGRYYLFHQTNGLFARIWGNYSNRQD